MIKCAFLPKTVIIYITLWAIKSRRGRWYMLSTNIILFFYSTILLLTVLVSNARSKTSGTSDKLFNAALLLTIVLLFFDVLSYFEGLEYPFYPLFTHVGTFVLFLLSPLIAIIWFLYVHFEIYSDEKRVRKYALYAIPIMAINTILVIMTQFTGWLYTIDALNMYHRGPIYIIPDGFSMLVIVITFVMLTIERKRFQFKHYLLYVAFGFIPIIALVLQSLYYGISYTLNAVSLAITMIYLSIQNKRLKNDYLTNTFNRMQLDYYLQDKYKGAQKGKCFTTILVDLDNFKEINDTYGHPVGDEALKTAANLIRFSVGKNDFLARLGGDEFCIITEECHQRSIEMIVSNMHHHFAEFNEYSLTYQLRASIGHLTFDKKAHLTLDEYKKQADRKL